MSHFYLRLFTLYWIAWFAGHLYYFGYTEALQVQDVASYAELAKTPQEPRSDWNPHQIIIHDFTQPQEGMLPSDYLFMIRHRLLHYPRYAMLPVYRFIGYTFGPLLGMDSRTPSEAYCTGLLLMAAVLTSAAIAFQIRRKRHPQWASLMAIAACFIVNENLREQSMGMLNSILVIGGMTTTMVCSNAFLSRLGYV